MRVAFLHPDLGLGGAERLIVDAAAELVKAGHTVDVYTAYYDSNRCFEETKTAGFRVIVSGGWFPRQFAGRCIALCAYIRCLIAALYIAWVSRRPNAAYDVVIADQVSVVIPLLHCFTRSRVLFYCHFPDLLLTHRRGRLKQLYRVPLDWLEQETTGRADLILVNSIFTKTTFGQTFQHLHQRGIRPKILYPAVALPTSSELESAAAGWRTVLGTDLSHWIDEGPLILSINRFERKKGLDLSIKALHALRDQTQCTPRCRDARLLLAGGYDKRLTENVEHLQELKRLVSDLKLDDYVRFLPSFTDTQRAALLSACVFVVYTPQHEHFGIVPLEAMAAARPVIAVNNGGPLESVEPNQTGLLCDPTPGAFAEAYRELLNKDSDELSVMGGAARQRVQERFSRDTFGRALNMYVHSVAKK